MTLDEREQSNKRRRHCPVCGSLELTRPSRTWKERMMERLVGVSKFRCFICGHVFSAEALPSSSHSRRDG